MIHFNSQKITLIFLLILLISIQPVYAISYTDLHRTVIGEITPEYENWLLYTETDLNSHLNVTQNHLDFKAYRNEDCYLYYDKGINHFENFSHLLDVTKVDHGTQAWGQNIIWLLSNAVNDIKGLRDSNETCIYITVVFDGGNNRVYLSEAFNNSAYESNRFYMTEGTEYYLEINKTGTSFSCKIYSDSARTNLLSTLTLTLHATHKFQYVFSANTYNDGTNGGKWTETDIDNLDLQEALYPNELLISELEESYQAKLYNSQNNLICNGTANTEGQATLTLPDSYRSNSFNGTYRIYDNNGSYIFSKWFEDIRGGDQYEIISEETTLGLAIIGLVLALFALILALSKFG